MATLPAITNVVVVDVVIGFKYRDCIIVSNPSGWPTVVKNEKWSVV